MDKYIGKTVIINGKNSVIRECVDCGSLLSVKDYNFSDGKCASCRSKDYGAMNSKYIDIDGSNRIDEILNNKVRRI